MGLTSPRNFEILNTAIMYNTMEQARGQYGRLDEGKRASACVQCRECEPKCPQSIPISEWMPVVHQVLGEGQALEACNLLSITHISTAVEKCGRIMSNRD